MLTQSGDHALERGIYNGDSTKLHQSFINYLSCSVGIVLKISKMMKRASKTYNFIGKAEKFKGNANKLIGKTERFIGRPRNLYASNTVLKENHVNVYWAFSIFEI